MIWIYGLKVTRWIEKVWPQLLLLQEIKKYKLHTLQSLNYTSRFSLPSATDKKYYTASQQGDRESEKHPQQRKLVQTFTNSTQWRQNTHSFQEVLPSTKYTTPKGNKQTSTNLNQKWNKQEINNKIIPENGSNSRKWNKKNF